MQHAHLEPGQPLPLMPRTAMPGHMPMSASAPVARVPDWKPMQAEPLFDASPLPTWLLDTRGLVLASNLRAREDMAACVFGGPLACLLAQRSEHELLTSALGCSLSGFPVTSTPLSLLNVQGHAVAGELYLSASCPPGGEWAVFATFAPHRGETAGFGAARACPATQVQMDDLRTLAGAVSGFAQIIRASVQRVDLVRASDIEVSVEDLSVCSSQLVGLSEEIFDLGNKPAQPECPEGFFALNPLITHVVQEACRSYAPLELNLEWTPVGAGFLLPGSSRRVGRVLRTLVDNAARFSVRRSSIQVSVCASEGRVSVGVHDEGQTLDAAALQAPFKAGPRQVKAADSYRDASGLALYFAHRHAVDMRGGLRCEPREPKGATFWLDLPLAGCALS